MSGVVTEKKKICWVVGDIPWLYLVLAYLKRNHLILAETGWFGGQLDLTSKWWYVYVVNLSISMYIIVCYCLRYKLESSVVTKRRRLQDYKHKKVGLEWGVIHDAIVHIQSREVSYVWISTSQNPGKQPKKERRGEETGRNPKIEWNDFPIHSAPAMLVPTPYPQAKPNQGARGKWCS